MIDDDDDYDEETCDNLEEWQYWVNVRCHCDAVADRYLASVRR